jgi:nitrate reductase NapAB chaperone NapD
MERPKTLLLRLPRLDLDYVARRRIPWAGFLVFATALLFAGFLLESQRQTRIDAMAVKAELERAGAERRPARPISRERLEEETRSAQAVVRQLNFPWAGMVQAIEKAAIRDVALLQLQPNADARTLRLVAEARESEAMFEFLRRLGTVGGLSEVHLVNHQVRRDDSPRSIRFSVIVSMKGLR